jgi:hypothetical protein
MARVGDAGALNLFAKSERCRATSPWGLRFMGPIKEPAGPIPGPWPTGSNRPKTRPLDDQIAFPKADIR